jgi:hypothetical protein
VNAIEKQLAVPTPSANLGRHLFGVAALASGLVTLVWHDYHDWHVLRQILNPTDGPVFVYAAAAAQIFGGAAIQFRRTAKTGAIVLCAVYLVLALLFVPPILATPLVYDPWGNFFEQFAVVIGAAIVYARFSSTWPQETLSRIGRILLAICAISFALYQAVHLDVTGGLVPKWLPPSQTFWAVLTTVAFALAAVALLANRMALLATQLLTLMLVIFGLLVWVPLLLADPRSHSNWSETVITFAIAGTAWILADLLGEQRLSVPSPATT